jgi:hypothetical protein
MTIKQGKSRRKKMALTRTVSLSDFMLRERKREREPVTGFPLKLLSASLCNKYGWILAA